MKYFVLIFALIFSVATDAANVKISQLPLGSASSTQAADSFPYVDSATNITKRLTLWDLINIPSMVNTYAPIANPIFIGGATAPVFTGNLTGDVTGNADTATALAANPTDCTSGQYANAIASDGDLSCSAVATSELSGSIALGSQVSGTLPIANGGTGQSSAVDAFGALSPTTTNGDLIVRGSAANIRVGVGSDGFVLTANSAVSDGGMEWAAPAAAPVGQVGAFALTACPTGWILGDGSAVSRATYSALFSAMGTIHGTGDGTTTFNLPNYLGRFLRGWANGSTNDPDRASRTAMATGGATGDNVGSVQGHAFQTHTHTQNAHSHTSAATSAPTSDGSSLIRGALGPNNWNLSTSSATATNQNAGATGATAQASTNETRPVNAYVIYCVKF